MPFKHGMTNKTYSLLCELTGTLVLAVAEKFDNAALVWCETEKDDMLA